MIQTRVKERAEALASEMSDQQQAAIRALGNDLHRLNQTVVRCVESGPVGRAAPHRPPPRRRRLLGRPAGAGDRQAELRAPLSSADWHGDRYVIA